MILVATTEQIEHDDMVYTLHDVEYSPGRVSRDPWQPDEGADMNVGHVEVQGEADETPRRIKWDDLPPALIDWAWRRAGQRFDQLQDERDGGDE